MKEALTPAKMQKKSCSLVNLIGASYSPMAATSSNTTAAANCVKEEVAKYREVQALLPAENSLTWWKVHEGEDPNLFCQAKCYLSVPRTSVTAERCP